MMDAMKEYIPGVCNIGRAEIESRRRSGWFGLVAAFVLWIGLVYFHVSTPWRLLLFLPAAVGASGFLQASMHFCAAFGVLGVFNFGSQVGRTETVEQAEFRRADQRKALLIMFYSAVIGIIAALIGMLIPIP